MLLGSLSWSHPNIRNCSMFFWKADTVLITDNRATWGLAQEFLMTSNGCLPLSCNTVLTLFTPHYSVTVDLLALLCSRLSTGTIRSLSPYTSRRWEGKVARKPWTMLKSSSGRAHAVFVVCVFPLSSISIIHSSRMKIGLKLVYFHLY